MQVMSPLVSERIWALPVSGAAVKFLQYLVFRSEFGGYLPVRQKEMAQEYQITQQGVSNLLAALCEINIVLRPEAVERGGNQYRLHPFAAKYESREQMETAFRQATADVKAGDLPNLHLPPYVVAPPAEGRGSLRPV